MYWGCSRCILGTQDEEDGVRSRDEEELKQMEMDDVTLRELRAKVEKEMGDVQDAAALALAVKVGSVSEEENERGVAHIVEHLAFSATKSYTNQKIVKFLESIGASFDACGNAYTSCDETVYELFVPIDDPQLLSKAISILVEFSSEIRLGADDLEKERGAVMEEYMRKGKDADGRLQEQTWACLLKGSKYAERLPIGLDFGGSNDGVCWERN